MKYDLCVIGGGPGGVRAARLAGQAGLRVALVERAALGGTCVNLGCVPKKLFVYASHYAEDFSDARAYGWSFDPPTFDWMTLRRAKDAAIQRLNGVYARLLAEAGCHVIQGEARLETPREVAVGPERLHARHVLVATGGRALRPDIPGTEHGLISDDIFHLDALPPRAAVVGAGYTAIEMACILLGLGVQVSLVMRGDLPMHDFDDDLRQALVHVLAGRGMRILPGHETVAIEREGELRRLRFAEGDALEAEMVLFAIGRAPLTEGLGLEALGMPLAPSGGIPVDDRYQSPVEGIGAVGDVLGRMALTPVAIAEATAFVAHLTGASTEGVDYDAIPTAVFGQPPMASVGLTEAAARAAGHRLRIYRNEFRALRNAISGRREQSLVKLVVDAASDRVLGVHVLGPDADEVIQGFAVALHCRATKRDFDRTIGVHPTLAEELVTLRRPVRED
jgi:glutathione reductase (NADPH)